MGIPYWQALLNTSDWGMANMQWNLGWEKMNFWSGLNTGFMNASGALDWLTNPQVALWQVSQANNGWNFKNNESIFPSWRNIGNNWNMNPMNPWSNMGWTPSGNAGSGNSGKTETATQKEIKKINDIFKKIKEIADKNNSFLKDYESNLIVDFEEAAKTTKKEVDENGKEKTVKKSDEERLEDMKEALKAFGDKRIRVALVEGEYSQKLKNNGFDFKNSKSSLAQKHDKDIDENLGKLYNSIARSNYDELGIIASTVTSDDILTYVSKWNETHNSASERSILRFVAKNFPTQQGSGEAGFQDIIDTFTQKLIDKASEYEEYKGVKDAKKALEDAQAALNNEYSRQGHSNASLKSKVSAVADKFEALYAQVRMQEAAAIDKEIKDKYGDTLNDIIPNTIPENFIVDETKADLASEGITAKNPDEVKDEDWSGNTGAIDETEIKDLVSNGTIIETSVSKDNKTGEYKIYRSKGKNEKGNYQYFTVIDGKLVKLNGVVKCVRNEIKLYSDDNKLICNIKDGFSEEAYSDISRDEILTEDYNAKKKEESQESSTIAEDESDAVAVSSIDYSNASISDDVNMETAASEQGLTATKLKGYYMKNVNGRAEYYVYSSGEFTKMKDVVAIHDNGTAELKTGKFIPIREFGTSASSSGACLREKLAGDTTESRYNDARVILNGFSTYKDAEEIRDFFQGYQTENNWIINSKMAAQIVTENGFSDDEKKQYIKTIAEKAIILAQKADLADRGETIRELKEISDYADIELSCDSNWLRNLWYGSNITDYLKLGGPLRATLNLYHGNALVHTAKILDCLVEKVVDAYNKKNKVVEQPQQGDAES